DAANSITVDASGNVYVTGISYGTGTSYDYTTIKYNTNGDSLWCKRYNGPGNDYDAANSITVDASGNVYVTGCSKGSGTDYDYATIKYNTNGDSLWCKRYNEPGNYDDRATSIAIDASVNVYVTGRSASQGAYPYNYDYATIKYSTNGDSLWCKRYNGPGNDDDYANAIVVDASGNVYVTGSSFIDERWSYYTTIKYAAETPVDVEVGNGKTISFKLEQNYPNPFNPSTVIKYQLSVASKVTLKIYNVLDEIQYAGYKSVVWDASGMPSGMYFYRLAAVYPSLHSGHGFVETKKLILIR
ncbi:MAG: SBBP repeat-containing protein, partial [Bacteroidota bacterium]|nr:SBBP repeat-containing protein [Bacteroidota bacterium]